MCCLFNREGNNIGIKSKGFQSTNWCQTQSIKKMGETWLSYPALLGLPARPLRIKSLTLALILNVPFHSWLRKDWERERKFSEKVLGRGNRRVGMTEAWKSFGNLYERDLQMDLLMHEHLERRNLETTIKIAITLLAWLHQVFQWQEIVLIFPTPFNVRKE